jgi:SAM-dependent methyltransferase
MSTLLPLLVVAGIVLNGLRLRGRLTGLVVLSPSDAPVAPSHRFVTAAGVDVGTATRQAASAHVTREGLEVVDLVPADLRGDRALELARGVDPRTYRTDRLAPGQGAFHALLVDAGVLERAGVDRTDGLDPVGYADVVTRLKRYAAASTDLVVAPGLRAGPDQLDKRLASLRAVCRARLGPPAGVQIALPALVYALLAVGMVAHPAWGAVAVVAFCAQPYLVFAGGPLRPRDLRAMVLLRPLRDPVRLLRTVTGRWRPAPEPDPYEQRRAVYTEELAAGIERFFEPRRETCPWCGSTDLVKLLTSPDLFQRKPGRFTLERCRACRHVFQNPPLSIAGLNFYYRDFYDGLGGDFIEKAFANKGNPYTARAEMVRPFATPGHWLDVGGAYGHFCAIAPLTWPDTVFDALDQSENVEEAERRGWVSTGYRGLFPELTGELAGRYDMVSMHHYLEHTRDPRAELDAASKVLRHGGHLQIEVPDPASCFGRLLGRFWMGWAQPQHQHFVQLPNLLDALTHRGLTPVAVHTGQANLPGDLTQAVVLLVNLLAPDPRPPWHQSPPTRMRRLRRRTVMALAAPFMVLTLPLDHLTHLVLRRTSGGNCYRVLARKDDEAGGAVL